LILGLNKLVVFNIIVSAGSVMGVWGVSLLSHVLPIPARKIYARFKVFCFLQTKNLSFFFKKKNYWLGFLYFVVFRDFKQLIKSIQMCCWVACDRNTLAFLITKWSVMRLYWLLRVSF
jgi:hypothetical protein